MMKDAVALHYSRNDLIERIRAGLSRTGRGDAAPSVDDLGPVDEFHTGGRIATQHLLKDLDIRPGQHVLDIGCGIGGTSRYLADRFGVSVLGMDLVPDYIATGEVLNEWVSLAGRIDLRLDDATDMTGEDDTFDLAVMLHVGMNVNDKKALFAEAARVLKKGGRLAVYDVMLKGEDRIRYPVPWASDASMSFLEPSGRYEELLEKAGFEILRTEGRGDFAKSFFDDMQASMRSADGPPAMGLHLLIGPSITVKMANFSRAVHDDLVEPTEIITRVA